MPCAIGLAMLAAFCLCAVSSDVRTGRIPNALNTAGLLAGLAASLVAGGPGNLRGSLAGALLGAALLLPFFLLHMVGGGDVKFLAAAGSIMGWRLVGPSFLLGAAIGGCAGIAMLVRRGGMGGLLARLVTLEAGGLRGAPHPGRAEFAVPYALPLSFGLVSVYTAALLLGWCS